MTTSLSKTHKRRASIVLFLFSAVLILGCSNNLTYQNAMDKNRRNIDEMSKLEDANFLVEAASYNILERELSELAAAKGYSSALVEYGKLKIEEHEDLQKEISKLAKKKKIKIPGEMKSEHRIIYDRVSSEGRSDFDAAFINALQSVNSENTWLFESKSSEADDGDIRAFAARRLGFLRNNADELAKVDDQLMHTQR